MALTFVDTHNMIAFLTNFASSVNEEIFIELARMGYEKPSTKITFYKAFFSSQWKFLIHTILQCMSAKRTSWNEFSSSMASAFICLSTGRKFNFSKYIFDSLVPLVLLLMMFLLLLKNPLYHHILNYHNHHKIYPSTSQVQPTLPPSLSAQPPSPQQQPQPLHEVRKEKSVESIKAKKIEEGRIIANIDADTDNTLHDVADIAKEVAVDAEIEESADV
nr:synaptobrevin, longin-like domain protein [Tanacetum cinerariifolium]